MTDDKEERIITYEQFLNWRRITWNDLEPAPPKDWKELLPNVTKDELIEEYRLRSEFLDEERKKHPNPTWEMHQEYGRLEELTGLFIWLKRGDLGVKEAKR